MGIWINGSHRMFEIRPIRSSDIPEILQLMKSSLGDPHGRRNSDFWNWKHVNNPFGQSEVMVAESGNRIIGVRAMMPWEFQIENKIIRAWRAVDTATDPAFQGKGVFSSLNDAMIKHLSGIGPALIFNTPNPKSAKGYLKQGWESSGRAASILKPIFLNLIANRFRTPSKNEVPFPFQMPSDEVFDFTNHLLKNQLTTRWNRERLRWRYGSVPGLSYQSVNTDHGSVIFRIVRRGSLQELRVVEIFPLNTQLKTDIQELIVALSPDMVTCLIDGQEVIKNFLPSGFLKAGFVAPKLVCRELDDPGLVSDFKQESYRYFSAGTMELF